MIPTARSRGFLLLLKRECPALAINSSRTKNARQLIAAFDGSEVS